MDAIDAMPIENVSKVWKAWQDRNQEESKALMSKFGDMAILKGFNRANDWLVSVINAKTGIPAHLIREYQSIHAEG
jgi:hypothetical protein